MLTDILALADHFLMALPNINSGHIKWHAMDQQKFRPINWCMATMQCYHGRLRLDLGGCLSKINWLSMTMHRLRALISIEENKKRVAK